MPVTSETQYSIYKISFESVELTFDNIARGSNTTEYAKNIITVLINSIKSIISKKPKSTIYPVSCQGLQGLIFKTTHYPSWDDVAKQIIMNNEIPNAGEIRESFLTNTNVSYIYFYLHEDKIFAVTGGYGSNYITKFTEKNFGLYLLPKIIKKDNSVIKSVQQNNLLGNQTASQKTNKNSTSIQNEQDMSSIFRQLSIEATREIAESIGVSFDDGESPNKKINIVNKDSIVIHRSISINELKQIISKISSLENVKDNFALNYLVLARKKGLKTSELYETLLKTLVNEQFNNFILAGDDYTTFFTCASKYIIEDKNTKDVLINQEEPITFIDVINLLKSKNKTSFQNMLKNWQISTLDHNGNYVLYPMQIYDAVQGFIEVGENNQPCYLFNGQWYVFDGKFSDILDEEFNAVYDQQLEARDFYCTQFDLIKNCDNEETYNKETKKKGIYLVAHTALIDKIEISDIIFFKDKEIFLMHNKDSFNASGARDVINQVLTSAAYLQKALASLDKNDFLEKYYDAIALKYSKSNIKIPIDKESFKAYFQGNPKIHYLIGYLNGYKKNSHSTYAKYLTVEAIKKLSDKGYNITSLSIKANQ